MIGRSRLSLAVVVLAASVAVAPQLFAAPKDDAAIKLDKQAMDNDFLNVDFKSAEDKLRKAVNECGASGCSKEVKAKVQGHLAIILVNAGQQADAVAAFVEALKTDPSVTPDKDYTTPEVTKAFEEAKKKAGTSAKPDPTPSDTGTGGSDKPAPKSDLTHEVIKEAPSNTPIPIFAQGDGVSSMKLFYKPFGDKEFKSIKMNKMGKGYGVEIPCADTKVAGKLEYYINAYDSSNDPAGNAADKKNPYAIQIKTKIDGDAPAFPGKDPPATCKSSTECMSGVGESGCAGTADFGEQCVTSKECRKGLTCQKGTCQPGEGGDTTEEDDEAKHKMNWVNAGFDIDIAFLTGSDLCSRQNQIDGAFTCFKSNERQYQGNPSAGAGGTLSGFAALATMRVLLGFDRFVNNNIAVGAKLGYAFNGSPEDRGGKAFMPFHAEVRGTYWIGKKVLTKPGVFPFVYVSAGVGQVDAEVPNVRVPNDCLDGNYKEQTNCSKNSKIDVSAWKRMGTGFGAAGGGIAYAVAKSSALTADLKFQVYLPTTGFALSPTIGFMQGF